MAINLVSLIMQFLTPDMIGHGGMIRACSQQTSRRRQV